MHCVVIVLIGIIIISYFKTFRLKLLKVTVIFILIGE
jgi:hypothetical protein